MLDCHLIGFHLIPDVISEENEEKIISWLDQRTWDTTLSRRTQQFGKKYTYASGKVNDDVEPMVGPIKMLATYLETFMNASSCIVNEYTKLQGIAAHTDSKNFGPVIVGFSLGEDVVMTFTKDGQRIDKFLPRGSMMILSDESRYLWKHEISRNAKYVHDGKEVVKNNNYRRISLTFRC